MNLAAAFVAPPLDRTALVVDGRRTSYGELGERVDRWRVGLVAAGVSIGDRVALLAGNTEVFVIGYLACLAEGFVVVPLNPDSPPAEVERARAGLQALATAIERVEANRRRSQARSGLALSGAQVMEALGTGPGPQVGRALRFLTEWSEGDEARNEEGALRAALEQWARDQGIGSR